ncbi:peptidoglycan editing factor PgeF [Thermosipho ferrireducens]|uniref:Purine nucleoside phosphorylase n=1 Tax=Thermosipho ferrireducens TaxID=2571116 RepID=A0ABX7S5X6_9BACT|nr:peptidoglycan editing factor PgeF [Thermosipho ferrireducens]QTA37574.1 peptidoglycan editing factor PgeF [Thermosipho ferrireducens]
MQIGNYICKDVNGITICQSRLLFQFKNLNHFITTRKIKVGNTDIKDLDLSFNNENFQEHYNLLSDKLELDLNRMVFTNQVHGKKVEYIDESYLTGVYWNNVIKGTDGLMTSTRGIFLVTKYADCMPIIAYDPIKNVVGVVHSGWRGTLIETPKNLIMRMVDIFNCAPQDIFVSIGPSIGPESFEVGTDVAEKFIKKYGNQIVKLKDGKVYIDLWKIAEIQLKEVGIINIENSMIDTYVNTEYFYSYRKEKTHKRFAVFVGLLD